MKRQERDELARRLSVSAPTPERPPSFFDGLAGLAADSTPTSARVRRPRLLRAAAIATATTVLLSGAAYAGALGEQAQSGVRQVLGHGQKSRHQVDPDSAPLEKVAPVIVLERRAHRPAAGDPAEAGPDVDAGPTDEQPEGVSPATPVPEPSASGATEPAASPVSDDDPGTDDGPAPPPAANPADDDQGDDTGGNDDSQSDPGNDAPDDQQGSDEDGDGTAPHRTKPRDGSSDGQEDPADEQDIAPAGSAADDSDD